MSKLLVITIVTIILLTTHVVKASDDIVDCTLIEMTGDESEDMLRELLHDFIMFRYTGEFITKEQYVRFANSNGLFIKDNPQVGVLLDMAYDLRINQVFDIIRLCGYPK